MAASELGPLMPGRRRLRLSPWLCWVPSGSRDQKTMTKACCGFEQRQDGLGGGVGEPVLLGDIGDGVPGL